MLEHRSALDPQKSSQDVYVIGYKSQGKEKLIYICFFKKKKCQGWRDDSWDKGTCYSILETWVCSPEPTIRWKERATKLSTELHPHRDRIIILIKK